MKTSTNANFETMIIPVLLLSSWFYLVCSVDGTLRGLSLFYFAIIIARVLVDIGFLSGASVFNTFSLAIIVTLKKTLAALSSPYKPVGVYDRYQNTNPGYIRRIMSEIICVYIMILISRQGWNMFARRYYSFITIIHFSKTLDTSFAL